jgi:3-methylfumaryl-CoA hydratase
MCWACRGVIDVSEWQDFIGKTMVQRDVLTPGLAQRHGATLDLPLPEAVALPGIHWCLCLPEAATAQLGTDGHPRRDIAGSFLPPIPLPRRMWASSSVEFLMPIPVGAMVERTSTIADIAAKSGSSGQLVFVTVEHVTRVNGAEAVREKQSIVYREATGAAPAFLAPRDGDASVDAAEWPNQRKLVPSEPLLLRFSALTFNAHRIHYDLPYARDEEGYAGLVVHGPLTATFLLNHATSVFDAPVRRFSFRGASPAFCGEPLTLAARREGNTVTLAAINGEGQTVMTGDASI